jgi:hypothetical protein
MFDGNKPESLTRKVEKEEEECEWNNQGIMNCKE